MAKIDVSRASANVPTRKSWRTPALTELSVGQTASSSYPGTDGGGPLVTAS